MGGARRVFFLSLKKSIPSAEDAPAVLESETDESRLRGGWLQRAACTRIEWGQREGRARAGIARTSAPPQSTI